MTRFNKTAVEQAIARDPTIRTREAKLILALLKGRQKGDE